MKVLIAVKNRRMREFIKTLIDGMGYLSIEASNGLMAVDNFTFHKPDIVLMDIKMDIMDGIEATEKIRNFSSSVKIIIMSDFKDESLKQKAFKARADEFITKENLMGLKNILTKN